MEPAHRQDRWTSEAVLRGHARHRADGHAPESADEHAPDRADGHAPQPLSAPIEQTEAEGARGMLKRALAVPVLAGATVFIAAVIVSIVLATVQLQPGAAAATDIEGDLRQAVTSEASQQEPAAGDSPAATRVFVHVIGEVAAPGVVEVPSGARIAEVIEAAGGATEGAALDAVNLAREALDGEQLLVPNADQAAAAALQPPAPEAASGAAGGSGGPGGPGGSGGLTGAAGAALVDLNTANAAELETLPRVGPALAQRIIEWRDLNGSFASVEQLLEVSGIGAKTLAGLRELVRV